MKKTIALKEVATGRKDIFFIPESLLKEEEGFNARLEYTGIEEFGQFIAANGVTSIPPLAIYKKKNGEGVEELYISKGHRRIRAIRYAMGNLGADIQGAPCVYDDGNEEERTFGLISENSQVPLTKLEQGLVFLRLLGYGYKQNAIAAKLGKSNSFVNQCVTIASVPKKVQDLISQGLVTDSTVYDVATTEGIEPDQIFDLVMKSIGDADANGKGKRGVRSALHKNLNRTNPKLQAKLLGEWVEENSIVLKDDARYQAVVWALNFIGAKNADITLDGLDSLMKRTAK